MMTSSEIRQSFLDFFKSKSHTIVPSSSLMPDSPGLLFTNAGMNQFVPIFLNQKKPDVSKWAGAIPAMNTRAADTQKCIRAGGKHNDLEDVGLDTYHHTFFEMLGNWSFGDYFKKEAIEWAWELVVKAWEFPPSRLYATVFCPYLGQPGWEAKWRTELEQVLVLAMTSPEFISPDPNASPFEIADQEAAMYWAKKFQTAGLDPKDHIIPGNKKDNFWMMGETGPCGPCSEIHMDLTPGGDTKGSLVNKGDARCIEIWNLVFIQFNANPDGTFAPLPARHVDTGMGFERVTAIIQGTKGLKNFAKAKISNYETDIFRPIFDALEKLSGKRYGSTLPQLSGSATVPVVSEGARESSPATVGVSPTESSTQGATYYKRRLPHFERPWAKYMVSFSTRDRRQLSPGAKDIVLKGLLFGHDQRRYQLYAVSVMPDHVHFLFEPQIKEQDKDGKPIFWPLPELLHSIKSFTAHEINKLEKTTGQVWENESFDRMIRGDTDFQEKFHYICRNPWDSGVVSLAENYPWLWTPDAPAAKGRATVPVASVGVPPTESSLETGTSSPAQPSRHAPGATARDAQQSDRDGRAPQEDIPQTGALHSQEQIDIAFRVIADHIRTLGFAIADGIQPGNTDRNYVLRRILRRAVRYGRSLGFHEPFFYKLVDVVADTMGDVFSEIRAKKQHVQDVIRVEEEAFNKTLDRGIALFEEEVARLLENARSSPGGTGHRPVAAGDTPAAPGARYFKRNLPHFEKPWAIYVVNFQTHADRKLSAAARDIVFDCILHWRMSRYRLVAACVMPDHVHIIIQPGIKEQDTQGQPVFWSLSEILHSIKSFSAKEVNKLEGVTGILWQEERFDRYIRSDADLQEKFRYVCANPWAAGIADEQSPYRWLWTQEIEAAQPYVPPASLPYAPAAGHVARQDRPVACSTQTNAHISGAFAFKLYDEQGFPLDLTELMARERGLTVDVEGFNKLMEEQRTRARAAQKKEVISLSQIATTTPTKFVGYEQATVDAKILEIAKIKDKLAVVLDVSPFYAEMGGQVGDTGWLIHPKTKIGTDVINTIKSGVTWLHILEGDSEDDGEFLPEIGETVSAMLDWKRRPAIQRHHTVTHLLHWALHEVVSKEASQKGSFVGPDKLTFDFNSAPLTPAQVADIEKLVNERILENAVVSWTEVPYADVKSRKDVMQFFGDKYGDTVRVVQIGGHAQKLDGYSMELCGGTHTRATGEIGLFRIVSESAIAAGVRRIEAVAGLEAYRKATDEVALIKSLAGKLNSPIHELDKKIESLLARQKELEKSLQSAVQRSAAQTASWLLTRVQEFNDVPLITQYFPDSDGDYLQAVADALKGRFKGVVVLGGIANGAVALLATVSPEFTAKIQAGKIIQQIAPIVGGKGGGKPDNARGGGKDASKLDEALAKAKTLL